MKLVENIKDLKKGDTLIVKDNEFFSQQGYTKICGEVFLLNNEEQSLLLRCQETNTIEKIYLSDGKIFSIS
jgi:hypothetical protein